MSNKNSVARPILYAALTGILTFGIPANLAQASMSVSGAVTSVNVSDRIQVAQIFGGSKKRSKEAAELNLRVDGVEQEIRNITGKLEELSFQMKQLQDQLRRMQEDNEFRFQSLEGGEQKRGNLQGGKKSTAQTKQPDSGHVLGQLPKNFSDNNSGSSGKPSNGPLDLSALTGGNTTGYQNSTEPLPNADTNNLSVGEPGQDYETAYNRVLQGDYTGSEKMFRTFLSSYPNHHLAGNAQYWLGESLFARGLYRDAADAFLKSYSDYPGSTKGPDSLLKLGLALAGLGEQAAACATYGELLSKFPEAPASVKKRASIESNVIGCAS